MKVQVIGLEWGDEGKVTIEQTILANNLYLPQGESYSSISRYHGGNNSGQTRVNEAGKEVRSHLIPVGVDFPEMFSYFMSGGVFNPEAAVEEIKKLERMKRAPGILYDITPDVLGFDPRLQVTLQYHLDRETQKEEALGKRKIGTTKKGIGTTYVTAADRTGLRLGEFCNQESFAKYLFERVEDRTLTSIEAQNYLDRYKKIAEFLSFFLKGRDSFMREYGKDNMVLGGSQSMMLDLFDGTFPYVTSSSTVRPPVKVDRRVGILKLINSRVGAGPFIAEMTEELQAAIRGNPNEVDGEYGKSTGRPRSLGWMDLFAAKYAVDAGDVDSLALTRLDTLGLLSQVNSNKLLVCTDYTYKGTTLTEFPDDRYVLENSRPKFKEMKGWSEDISRAITIGDLPTSAIDFLKYLSEELQVPWDIVKVGPKSEQFVVNPNL